ncbi:MAG TPA: amidohydrolase [Acidimicrobiales bacterium]|nr:amidohydrolase [Acidimicrobiales bacterium]
MQLQRYAADTIVTCDANNSVYSPGVIDVEDGNIVWVGNLGDEEEREIQTHKIGGLLMPGLVNAHCHTPMTLVRGAGDGLPLQRWLAEAMWPREGKMNEEDAYWGMTLGSAEMFRAGVTTSCEMYLFEEALVEAANSSGARLVMTPGVFKSSYSDSRLQDFTEFYNRHHNPEGRITVGLGPHSAYDLGIPACIELAEFAKSLDVLLHIHLAETREESSQLESEYGKSIVEILSENGILEGNVLAAHCVWLNDNDISLLADSNVSVAHCPISNMKLGSGIAPIEKMLEKDLTVGLGTDGPASNDTLDLWEEVKIAALLARVNSLDATLITPSEALGMATRKSANAIGLNRVGSLEVGWEADMIRIDTEYSTFTPSTDVNETLAHLVWSGSNRSVTDVWVAGSKVLSEGDLVTIDEERALREVKERAFRLAEV